jgi:hypothetical protein
MSKQSYLKMPIENEAFEEMGNMSDVNFKFQQDGASPHRAAIQDLEEMGIVLIKDWPAKSCDLSTIEQCWTPLKAPLKGKSFRDADELFDELSHSWDEISPEFIRNTYESFPARLQVCIDLSGLSLNGHWADVHRIHHRNEPTVEEEAQEIAQADAARVNDLEIESDVEDEAS